jgi:hypothetical protein
LSIKAPLRAFLNLANARAATLIIGNTELRLGAQHFNVLSAIANCMIGKTVPPGPSSGAESSNCPVQASNLLVFRGYRFGMSAQEVRNLFPGGAPPISEPDNVGRRSMKVEFPDASDPSGATKLSQLEVHFLDDRVFYISASYSIGKEWQNRLSDFANSISNGLGVSVAWNENYNGNARKLFRITCDALSMNLFTDEESEEIKITSQSKRPWTANATLHLVDEIAASRMRERLPKNSQ